jgi:thiol:disulfide interchange protein DsbC
MRSLRHGATFAAVLLAPGIAPAQADEPTIRAMMKEKYPDVVVDAVSSTPYAGLYEIVSADQIVYTDVNGSFLFVGRIIDARSGKDLTFERRIELGRVEFDTLPLPLAIRNVKGNGARRLAVFADPDCPYCRQLELDIADITDVTVYTFLFPIESLHPSAGERAKAVWCSTEPAQAWTDLMLKGVTPRAAPASCEYPGEQLASLGRKYNVTGTPTLVFNDGRRVPGLIRREELERLLVAPATR